MPFWATEPIAALLAGGVSRYQGSVCSNRDRVAVASSPAMDFSQASELGVTTGRSTGSSSYVVKVILLDCLERYIGGNLFLLNQLF